MSEKWKKWQTRRNKLSIVYFCLAIFFIVMMIFIMFGLFKQEDLANLWDWS